MYIKQISILALGLILSHESFAANPAIRAGALRLNTSSSSTQSTQSVTNPSSTTGALASYERASRLRPNRVQIGAVSGGTTNNANTELLNTVYAEMERVTNAVEQELYVTQRQIDDLKEEIEERDEKIQELEEALEDYEDLKETVKNIPSVYYTKREVDAKGYVMPKTMENAINVAKTSAISSARDQAVAEIQNKGFITADTVYQDIAVAKDKAVADAKEAALVAVKDMGFATVGKLNEVVSAERAARQDALKSYATKAQVATDIENVKTAAVDDAIAAVDERNFATISAVDSAVLGATVNIREERENALKSYATKAQVASDIATAKTAAVDDAVAVVDERGFATVSAVDGKLANLELGVDNETVTSIVDDRINAHNFATISAVDSAVLGATVNIREERENALKSYATKEQLAADIASVKTAAVDDAVAAVDERNFATISAVDSAVLGATVNIREERENALKSYATKEQLAADIASVKTAAVNDAVAEVDERGFVKQATADEIFATKTDLTAVDNKFKNISNTVAVDLAQNDSFKAQVLDSLDSSISELPSKVTVMETKIASLDKELFDGGVPKFAKKIDMDEFRQTLQDEPTKIIGREKLIDTEYVVGKLPATVCRTKDCLTSMIGDHYTTDSKVALRISDSLYEGGDTSKPKFTTIADREGLVARIDVVEGSFKPAVLKEKILGIKENNVNVFALKSDVDAEANARNVALSDLNTTITVVDKKFGDYTKTADLGNVNVITDKISIAKSEAISGAVAQAANERTNALKSYATNSALNTVDGKFGNYTTTSAMNTKISNAKDEAVAQAASERDEVLSSYATQSWVEDKGYATKAYVTEQVGGNVQYPGVGGEAS